MIKPYTWEEIRLLLIKELKRTKHIMTFGTIGSCNVEHDIDVIITKNPKSKSSGFYKEIHNLFDNLNNYLYKKYKLKAVRFAKMEDQFIAEHLAGRHKKNILFHTLVYISYPQIERDWEWALFPDEDIKKILLSYNPLKGKLNDLFSKDFSKEGYCDGLFIYLYFGDRLNSHYPNELLLKSMNNLFDYIYRKRLKLKSPLAKNKKEVKKYFYRLCDILDNLNKKHNH